MTVAGRRDVVRHEGVAEGHAEGPGPHPHQDGAQHPSGRRVSVHRQASLRISGQSVPGSPSWPRQTLLWEDVG